MLGINPALLDNAKDRDKGIEELLTQAKYWSNKFNEVAERYQQSYTIQPKEIVFQGTEYIEPGTGNVKKVEEKRVENNNMGDITNLLINLF